MPEFSSPEGSMFFKSRKDRIKEVLAKIIKGLDIDFGPATEANLEDFAKQIEDAI